MHGEAYAERLGRVIVEENLSAFTRAYETLTVGPHAEVLARLTLSVGQGALFNLLIDGDRPAADAVIAEFTAMVRAAIGPPNAEPRSISDASP